MKERRLCVLTFFILLNTSFALDFRYESCKVQKTCGDMNISYPFFIPEQQPSFCGFPGFNLSCNHSRPIIKLTGMNYIVHNINYDNQTLQVSNAAFSDSNTEVCLPLIKPITFPNDQYQLADAKQTELHLLYNCNSSVVDDDQSVSKYKVGCFPDPTNVFRNVTYSVLALPGEVFDNVSTKCGPRYIQVVVAAPVIGYDKNFGSEKEPALDVLKRGFILRWLATSCSVCENSGGKCGFNYTTYHFSCFCPDSPHSDSCKGEKRWRLWLGLGIGIGGVILLVSCSVSLWLLKHKMVSSNLPPRNQSELEEEFYMGLSIFTYNDLEEATNHFDSQKEVGSGGYGTVYHGELKDGREVAVKRFLSRFDVDQFENEIELLTCLRHKNLVTIYGCTSRRNSNDLLLVYEYLPNGTVADHLHGELADRGLLTWHIRMSIAIEAASALTYLHASDVIHRDVKTANILLDDNFSAKVADFGLSRFFPHDSSHVVTGIKGTPGYIDPAYQDSGLLTTSSDVFSFGVVLVELISSLPAVDVTRPRGEVMLSELALKKIQEGFSNELLNSSLGFELDNHAKRMAVDVAGLAFRCLQHEIDMRPPMSEVLDNLKKIASGNEVPESSRTRDVYQAPLPPILE